MTQGQRESVTYVGSIGVYESAEDVAAAAAQWFASLAMLSAAQGRPFRVALSGGSTPKLLYGMLASDAYKNRVPWDRIEFFFGDERWVPHTHKESNYKLANDELFSKVRIDHLQVFPMPTEGMSPDEAAGRYEATLRELFNVKAGEVPQFDLIFLGMGDDGHTASLFPHTAVLHEKKRLVAAPYVEKLGSHRITLTPPVLQAAKQIIFMVAGEGKAHALREVLEGEENIEEYPSQLLRHAKGRVTWLVDKAAAAKLGGNPRRSG